jgi:DNA-binding transcriptional MerR regulator
MALGRVKTWPRKSKSKSAARQALPLPPDLKIGEAARLIGVEAYVLRFWETQFTFLRPRQSPSRHRHYCQADLEKLKIIKRLLYTEGFTIAGARKFVREKGIDLLRDPATRSRETGSLSAEQSIGVLESDSSKGNGGRSRVPVNGKLHHNLREIREDLRILYKLLNGYR